MYVFVLGGYKCSVFRKFECVHIKGVRNSFFRKFDMLCFLEAPVLRFALLPYSRRIYSGSQFNCVERSAKQFEANVWIS